MSNCPLCLKQLQSQTHYTPNQDYFTIQTTIKTPYYKQLLRRRAKRHNQHQEQIREKSHRAQRSYSKERGRIYSKGSQSKLARQNSQDPEKNEVGILKTRISQYELELHALKQSNQELRNQMAQMRARSETRTPFYPTQSAKEPTSIGKIVRDKLLQIKSGKISLGSNKATVEDMDELLIASSHPSSHSSSRSPTQNTSEQSQYLDDYPHPTHKFTELMLKLQQPNNQSEQRMIRNEALRVAGKIRESKQQSERLYQGLYYS